MKRISISIRDAKAIAAHLRDVPLDEMTMSARDAAGRLAEEIARGQRAEAARKSRSTQRLARRKAKTARTSDVRTALVRRAGLYCECGCGQMFKGPGGVPQLDHFFGRARAESVETCWLLRTDCHERKTRNEPSRPFWLERFICHAEHHGYAPAAELARALLDSRLLVDEAETFTRSTETEIKT